jgi:hypothetical protein
LTTTAKEGHPMSTDQIIDLALTLLRVVAALLER